MQSRLLRSHDRADEAEVSNAGFSIIYLTDRRVQDPEIALDFLDCNCARFSLLFTRRPKLLYCRNGVFGCSGGWQQHGRGRVREKSFHFIFLAKKDAQSVGRNTRRAAGPARDMISDYVKQSGPFASTRGRTTLPASTTTDV